MSLFLNLNDDLCFGLFLHWIDLGSLAALDSSVCVSSERPVFLKQISNSKIHVSNKFLFKFSIYQLRFNLFQIKNNDKFWRWCLFRRINFRELYLCGSNFNANGIELKFKINLLNVVSLHLHLPNEQFTQLGIVNMFNSCLNLSEFFVGNLISMTEYCVSQLSSIVLNRLEAFHCIRVLSPISTYHLLKNCQSMKYFNVSVENYPHGKANIENEFASFVKNNSRLHTIIIDTSFNDSYFLEYPDIFLSTISKTCEVLRKVELVGSSCALSFSFIVSLFKNNGQSLIKVNIQNQTVFGFAFVYTHDHCNCGNSLFISDHDMVNLNESLTWSDVFRVLKPTSVFNIQHSHYITSKMLVDFGEIHKNVWNALSVFYCENVLVNNDLISELTSLSPYLKYISEDKKLPCCCEFLNYHDFK